MIKLIKNEILIIFDLIKDFIFKKQINKKLSSIEESTISSFNQSVKSRKSNSI